MLKKLPQNKIHLLRKPTIHNQKIAKMMITMTRMMMMKTMTTMMMMMMMKMMKMIQKTPKTINKCLKKEN